MKTILLAFISALLCFGQSSSPPTSIIGKLAGTWTRNEAKSKVWSAPLRFRTSPEGGLEEVRGSDAAPLVEPVHFDGKPYDIDGGQASIVWKQMGGNQFERTSSAKGQLVDTRRITISNGGKTLTQVSERKGPDGNDGVLTIIYGRSSGEGSGLVGVWNAQSRHTNNPGQFTVRATGPSSLKWTDRLGHTYTVAPDNKPVPVTGPGVISGTMVAYRQIDDHTLASTDSRNGVVTGNSTMELSPDGKVLTITAKRVGPNTSREGSVSVYEKK